MRTRGCRTENMQGSTVVLSCDITIHHKMADMAELPDYASPPCYVVLGSGVHLKP